MASPLKTYLTELVNTHRTGAHTPETSFYPALKTLLDTVGARLKPRVRCVMNLRNAGAGLPDGGLFAADQFARTTGRDDPEHLLSIIPERGAIEVKPPSADMQDLAKSEQVSRYGDRYRHVLTTNLRQFWLLERTSTGTTILEQFELADSASRLWRLPPKDVRQLEPRFLEFLERVLRTPAPLEAPEDLAWFLASYARDSLAAIENAPADALEDVADGLGRALGVGFRGVKGRHFFNSTLVQTLFYGVFSGWVLWCRSNTTTDASFSWKNTSELLRLPVLRVLFHEMTRPTKLFTVLLRDRLELTERTLNRVDHGAFFKRFREHEAIQYFYEPFLEAFDPELRKELGVWYTPDEVVRYMVERVDRELRDALEITDGLADSSVYVLDPCCGTGAFLLAVLERIARTLTEQGAGSTVAAQVAAAAKERVLGFEILPAPFVVSHLQLGLHLHTIGAPLPPEERAAVYLTNALTGWSKAKDRQQKLLPELAEERDAADRAKRKIEVLVVLGNPPYNAFAGIQAAEEEESVDVYKEGLAKIWGVRKFNLDDLFVRFFRLAERKIAEHTGRGIVCFISNASYAADASFVVFRERFLKQFDMITIDNLNGDSRETGKLTPAGEPDPSIFSTSRNREGIRVGTAIGCFVLKGNRKGKPGRKAQVNWREFWGIRKKEQLLESLEQPDEYRSVEPTKRDKWSFRPRKSSVVYREWPKLTELAGSSQISGLAEKRKGGLLSFDPDELADRMRTYFDRGRTWEDVQSLIAGLADDAGRYPARDTRTKLLDEGFYGLNIRRYALLPLDHRWCYYSSRRPLWNEPRPALVEQAWEGNRFLIFRNAARRPDEGYPTTLVGALPDHHLLDPNIIAIPLHVRQTVLGQVDLQPNVSRATQRYVEAIDDGTAESREEAAANVLFHCLAVMYSGTYLRENGEAVRADVPRVPLPDNREALIKSAQLGKQLADLLDCDVPVVGVTSGKIPEALRELGVLRRIDDRSIDPGTGDLAISERWGALQRGFIVMPGVGRVARSIGNPTASPFACEHLDVWLNDRVCWQFVPRDVWELRIGGYPVVKKWLSYRDKSIIGRDLSLNEGLHVTAMVRRLSAILLMQPLLDDAYEKVASSSYPLPME